MSIKSETGNPGVNSALQPVEQPPIQSKPLRIKADPLEIFNLILLQRNEMGEGDLSGMVNGVTKSDLGMIGWNEIKSDLIDIETTQIFIEPKSGEMSLNTILLLAATELSRTGGYYDINRVQRIRGILNNQGLKSDLVQDDTRRNSLKLTPPSGSQGVFRGDFSAYIRFSADIKFSYDSKELHDAAYLEVIERDMQEHGLLQEQAEFLQEQVLNGNKNPTLKLSSHMKGVLQGDLGEVLDNQEVLTRAFRLFDYLFEQHGSNVTNFISAIHEAEGLILPLEELVWEPFALRKKTEA